MERSTVQSCLAAPFFCGPPARFYCRFLIHRTRNQSPRYPLTARVHHRPRGTIMGTEVELKLATSRSELRKAMALPWLTKMAAEPAKHQHLTSVYFDTPDLVLRDRGISLRVRRVGDQRLQTIKASSGALVQRDEWEYE